ncbi:MAG: glycosyltransferase [Anaerolineae bacterium]
MRRRILYVEMAHAFGGSIVSLYQLVRGLDKERYEPVVLFYRPNPFVQRFEEAGAEVLVLGDTTTPAAGFHRPAGSAGRRRPNALAETLAILRQVGPGTLRLLRIIRRKGIDLVHGNDVLISNREAILAAALAGVPYISHVRAFETLTWLDRRLVRGVRMNIYISRAIAEAHVAQGVPAERGVVIYNALEPEEFATAESREAVRARLGLSPAHEVVGITGRLVAWKGHEVFLRAVAELVPKRPALRAVIAGDADPTEPAHCERLKALAGELGIADRVLFAGYWERIVGLLPALDVLVHCSVKPEPFGRVIIEGMAAGVPVVGANAGAVPEIITDGETGLLVPPGDAPALAEAIGRLLDDAVLAEAVRQRARELVRRRFSLDVHVAQVQALYERVLGGVR